MNACIVFLTDRVVSVIDVCREEDREILGSMVCFVSPILKLFETLFSSDKSRLLPAVQPLLARVHVARFLGGIE